MFGFRELHDQNRVLGCQSDQHNIADLNVNVVVVTHQPDAKECSEGHEGRAEQNRPRQTPALVKGSEQQENEYDSEDKCRSCWRRHLFLVRQTRVGEAHFLRHRLFKNVLKSGQSLAGSIATPGHTIDFHRTEQIEAVRNLRAVLRSDGYQGREWDHAVGSLAAHVDVTDVTGLATIVRIRLDIDAKQPAEAIEVVHVRPAHDRRQRLKHLVDRHSQLARLLAVQVHFDLRITRIKGGKEISQFRPFARRFKKLTGEIAQLLYAERSAAI